MYGFYCVPYVLYNCKNQKSENFLHFDNILSMKELNTPYRKMALMKQDKKGGLEHAKEGYQRLQTFYRVIGNYIVENKGADCDEEEGDQVETFRNFYFDQRNTFSHMLLIENQRSSTWRHVLVARLGEPDKGENGLIFKLKEVLLDKNQVKAKVTVTAMIELWQAVRKSSKIPLRMNFVKQRKEYFKQSKLEAKAVFMMNC